MGLREREVLHTIEPYVAGKSIEEAKWRFKLKRVIKLASNENPFGPSPNAVLAMKRVAKEVAVYPPMDYAGLRGDLARFYEVTPEQVALGNGSDELMLMAAQAFVEPGDEVILSRSTFSTYEKVTRLVGGKPVYVDLQDGRYDLSGMLSKVTKKTRLVYLCNPNNPTGGIFTEKEFAFFIKQIPEEVVVVLDEAYCEYVVSPEYPKSLSWIKQKKNLLVLRTFSKVYGLAALRVGYGLGDPELIRWFHQVVRLPFNVNRVGEAAAMAALADRAYVKKSLKNNQAGKRFITAGLLSLGYQPEPSEGNFIFFDVRESADDVADRLMSKGVIVRSLASFGFPMSLRVTIGTPEQNRAFLQALGAVRSRVM